MATKICRFKTKKEALNKLKTLNNPETYHIVKNRTEDGRFTSGWILEKLN